MPKLWSSLTKGQFQQLVIKLVTNWTKELHETFILKGVKFHLIYFMYQIWQYCIETLKMQTSAVSTWLETRWVWLNISPWLNSWAALDLFAVLLFEDKVTSCPHFGWNVGMLNWSWLSSNLFETLLLVVAILHAKTIGNAPTNGYALEKMTKTTLTYFFCLSAKVI